MASKSSQEKQNDRTDVSLAVISTDLAYIKQDVAEIKRLQQTNYVSHDEFEPIKRIVYGLVGIILVAVVGALVSLVVRQ